MNRISFPQQAVKLFEDIACQGDCNFIAVDKDGIASGIDYDVRSFGNSLQIFVMLAKKLLSEINVGKVKSGLLAF